MHLEVLRKGLCRIAVPSPTLPPATHTNAWLIGKQTIVIVDPAGVQKKYQQQLADLLAPYTVLAIFLTHHHHDHIGGALDLQNRTHAPIWASEYTASKLSFPVDRFLTEQETLSIDGESWQVLHTPGHARGHLCLFSALHKDLVAGDMVAGEGTILIDPPEGNLSTYLGSLQRLALLQPNRLLPAHGPAIQPAVPYLEHYIQHRHKRTEQIREAISKGIHDPYELAKHIYASVPKFFWKIGERQILAHLEWLTSHGQVQKTHQGYFLIQT